MSCNSYVDWSLCKLDTPGHASGGMKIFTCVCIVQTLCTLKSHASLTITQAGPHPLVLVDNNTTHWAIAHSLKISTVMTTTQLPQSISASNTHLDHHFKLTPRSCRSRLCFHAIGWHKYH
jgi:hypothetical protein